jgi:hypothetical protein
LKSPKDNFYLKSRNFAEEERTISRGFSKKEYVRKIRSDKAALGRCRGAVK